MSLQLMGNDNWERRTIKEVDPSLERASSDVSKPLKGADFLEVNVAREPFLKIRHLL